MSLPGISLEGWRQRRRGREPRSRPLRVAVVGEGPLAQEVTRRLAGRGTAEVILSSESPGAREQAIRSLGHAVRHTVRLEGAAPTDALIACAAAGTGGRLPASRVADLALWAARTCPDSALIIAASGGLSLSREASRASGLSPYLILSPGGMPRAVATAAEVAGALGVSAAQVQIPVIGGDDSAQPSHALWGYATVSGMPVREMSPVRTQGHRAARNPSDIALAAAATTLALAVTEDRRQVLCCGCWVEGSYGIPGAFVTAPVPVGLRGAEEPIPLRLTLEERSLLQRAAVYLQSPAATNAPQ